MRKTALLLILTMSCTLLQSAASSSSARSASRGKLQIEHISGVKADDKGNLSRKTLAALLRASKTVKAQDSDFGSVQERHIKRLSTEDSPWGTSQLFRFTNSRGERYIIKGISNSAGDGPLNEIERLETAATNARLSDFVHPACKDGYPQFIFPNAYLSYTHKSKRNYIVIMREAKGKPLTFYLKSFKTAYRNGNKAFVTEAARAFFHVGRKMSRFYQDQLVSRDSAIIHGDFHMGNIFYFYDEKAKKSRITLIDNERVCHSLDGCISRAKDVAFLCLKSMCVAEWLDRSFYRGFPYQDWYDLFLSSFIAGYLSSYSQDKRKEEYGRLKKWIISYKDENNKNWYTSGGFAGHLHKEFIKPVFDRIERSRIFFNIDTQSALKHDEGGRTLLHNAAKTPGETIAIWPLIAAGAQVNARDNHRNIPLHEAAWANRGEAVKRLISAGSNKHAKDREDSTPLAKARYNHSDSAISMLRCLGATH